MISKIIFEIKKWFFLWIGLILVLLNWLFFLLGQKTNFFLCQQIIGTILCFLGSGYLLSFLFFKKKEINFWERVMVVFVCSFFYFVLFSLSLYRVDIIEFNFTDLSFLFLFQSVFLGFIIFLRERKNSFDIKIRNRKNIKNWLFLFLPIFFYLGMLSLFISQFIYIKTPDASYFFSISKYILETGQYPVLRPNYFPFIKENYQPLMQTFAAIWSIMSSLNLMTIYRFGIPILSSIFFLPIFLILKQLKLKEATFLLTFILILGIPVLTSQNAVSRPQTFIFFFALFIIYALTQYIKIKNQKRIIWFILAFLKTILGIAYLHLLFVNLIPLLLAAIIYKNYQWIKNNPSKTILLVLIIFIILYPYLKDLGIFEKIFYLFRLLKIDKIAFRLFDNPFGITTYVANYALALMPLMISGLILVFKKYIKFSAPLFLISIYSFVYLAFQEILPRLNIFLLPDRAFPHLALSLIFFSAIAINWIIERKNKILFSGLIILLVSSIGINFYINLLPQKYIINQSEKKAIDIINQRKEDNQETPLLITQFGNYPLVYQFANFNFITKDSKVKDLFNDDSGENFEKIYQHFLKYVDYCRELQRNIDARAEEIKLMPIDNPNLDLFFLSIKNAKRIQKYYSERALKNFTIFIFYSKIKDQSFYKRFDWWQEKNFLNANLKKFDEYPEIFNKIYEDDNIVIWKMKYEKN